MTENGKNLPVAQQPGGALATPDDKDPFSAYGEQTRQTAIIGKLLKFSKGDWMYGEDNDEMPHGATFICNMDQLLVGWVRWSDNKPTDHVMGRVIDRYQPPRRDQLGDTDENEWDIDDDGRPRDPWQKTNYLLMMGIGDSGDELEGQLFTFTTSSRGGLNCIGDLCIKYGKQARQHADQFPVVALDSASYMHSNRAYGRIKTPILELVGWAPKSYFDEVDARAAGDEPEEDLPLPELKQAPAAQAEPKRRGRPPASTMKPDAPTPPPATQRALSAAEHAAQQQAAGQSQPAEKPPNAPGQPPRQKVKARF